MTTGPNETIASLRQRVSELESQIIEIERDNGHVRGLLETYKAVVKGAQTTNGLLLDLMDRNGGWQ